MSYNAQVYKVMIASPSDVENERRLIREVVHEWNSINSEHRGIILMPVGWETHSYPSMEDQSQAVVTRQVLADCDLLVAAFWTRIGTPTGSSPSGTVEEIEKHLAAGKPAMIYFSTAPVRPDSVDEDQYAALRTFREDLRSRGLVESYSSLGEFREKFARQLAQTAIHEMTGGSTPDLAITENGGFSVPRYQRPTLSEDAKTLLLAAAKDANGMIMAIRTMTGLSIQAGGKSFVEQGDARSEARWERALEELVDLEFIRDRGYKGEIFQLTADGYEAADQLELEG